jgi:uncharacterized protein YbjT (DUF2867 family)
MYAIIGATGNTGRIISENLLSKGELVRVIGRNAERLQSLVDKGAEVAIGTLEDPKYINEALRPVKAVYAMIPPNSQAEKIREYQNRIGENIANAIQNNKVKYIVNLSSLGAHLPEGTGIVLGLFDQEQRLIKIEDVNVVHLRPIYFMENLLGNIELIINKGINGSPLKDDVPVPVIAIKEIARVASKYLLELEFSGKVVHELLGEKDVTMNEAT